MERKLARLEGAVWMLVVLLSCVLASLIVTYVWMSAWSSDLIDVAATQVTTPLGGG
jgi:hypothetical protein